MQTTQRHLVTAVALLALAAGSLPAAGAPSLELFSVPAVHKIMPTEPPSAAWQRGQARLECAQNEWEAAQVVVRAGETVTGLALTVSALRTPQGASLPAAAMRLCRVEWVDANAPYEADRPSETPDFRPDPLPRVDPAAERFSVEPGRNLVFWVLIGVPEGATPGLYEGRLAVATQGQPEASLTLSLRVRAFALPRRPILQSLIGLAEGNLYKAHGCTTPEQKEAVIRLYFDEYIRARLSPFLYAPSTIAFNPLPGVRINWQFATGPDGAPTGAVTVDFGGFDREAELYLNQRQAFSAFNIAPYLWTRREKDGSKALALRIVDAKGTAVERLNADGSVNPVFDAVVVAVFRQIAQHLDAKGWLDRAIYYVTDEPGDDDTPAIAQVCRLVREADPRLRTALTYDPANRPRLAELVDAKGRSLISVWIPYCSLYREDVAAQQRARGAEYWLYDVKDTCLITHSGQTHRAMFWDVWRRDAKGYLYYLSTYWGRDATPWDRPSFMLPGVTYRYRQGDGYFFYPPQRAYNPVPPILDTAVTSIRWELLREGAEDYDTLRLLEDLTAAAEKRGLEAARAGREALSQARSLAESMAGSLAGGGIRHLQFTAREEQAGAIPGTGWSFSAQEGWLHHRGGGRADLPIRFPAALPDGRYQLSLNVYADTDYRGRPYSRFLVDGRPLATRTAALKGPEEVDAGPLEVKDGMGAFTLSALDEPVGVILYSVAVRRSASDQAEALSTVRTRLADAIETIQAALP